MSTACRTYPHEFDRDPEHEGQLQLTIAEARMLCYSCPLLGACVAYIDRLPKLDRPYGVVAGEYREWPEPETDRSPLYLTPKQRAAYDHLDHLVRETEVGTHLPGVDELATRYRINRQAVRLAVCLLEDEGRLKHSGPYKPRVVVANYPQLSATA